MTANPEPHMCVASYEAGCGCCRFVQVLGYGHDDDAYREAAREAKAGARIEHLSVAEFKARPWICPEHAPHGPPTWESNKRRAKEAAKAAKVAPAMEMGL